MLCMDCMCSLPCYVTKAQTPTAASPPLCSILKHCGQICPPVCRLHSERAGEMLQSNEWIKLFKCLFSCVITHIHRKHLCLPSYAPAGVCIKATGAAGSVMIWTDDLRFVATWCGQVHTLSLLSLFSSCIYIVSLLIPLSSLSRVARQAAASLQLSINNSPGDWLLPLRCRNILFPCCVPGQQRGGGGGEGGGAGPQRGGCSD